MHSASAQIGVATANLLPSFTINANGGYTNTALPGLIAPQNLFWILAGNATQTVFDGGTLLHQLQGAKDTYQAAAWTYAGTVVGAVQNVADSLHAIQNDADALKGGARFRTRRQGEFRSRAATDANRLRQYPRPAHRAADLSAGDHSGGAGTRRTAFRYRGPVPGARRRLVESRGAYRPADTQCRHRRSRYRWPINPARVGSIGTALSGMLQPDTSP